MSQTFPQPWKKHNSRFFFTQNHFSCIKRDSLFYICFLIYQSEINPAVKQNIIKKAWVRILIKKDNDQLKKFQSTILFYQIHFFCQCIHLWNICADFLVWSIWQGKLKALSQLLRQIRKKNTLEWIPWKKIKKINDLS